MCARTRLQPHWGHRGVVEELTRLECCNGSIQALQEGPVGWRGGDVTLYMTEQWASMELCLGRDDKPAESLWARIRGKTNVDNTVVGVC